MLDLKMHTMSPLLLDRARVLALSSGSRFGRLDYHDEWIIEHLNNFMSNLDNNQVNEFYDQISNLPFPDTKRHPSSNGRNYKSDILLKDVSRQHHSIAERYRKKLTNSDDIRMIAEPSTRLHISMSRGIERHLVKLFNKLETEAIDRQTILPILT